jgi:hypothetical protein
MTQSYAFFNSVYFYSTTYQTFEFVSDTWQKKIFFIFLPSEILSNGCTLIKLLSLFLTLGKKNIFYFLPRDFIKRLHTYQTLSLFLTLAAILFLPF